MKLQYQIIEREVYGKHNWALLVKREPYDNGWVLEDWGTKPAESTIKNTLRLFERSCEIYHRYMPRPSFNIDIEEVK